MDVVTILGYAVGVVGAILALTSKTKSDNLADLKQRVEILEKEREYAKEQHVENLKSIANLEGQLKTYKDIPLRGIDSSLAKLAESNDEILRTLQGSAEIAENASKSGGLLVHTTDKRPLAVKPVKLSPAK